MDLGPCQFFMEKALKQKRRMNMKFKYVLCMLLALAVVSPVMAKKKKKPIRGKFIKIEESSLVVKVKGKEKTYTLSDDVKFLNKDGEAVEASAAQFRIVELQTDPEDATKVTEVKEIIKKKKKHAKKSHKKKKDKKDQDTADDKQEANSADTASE